MNGNVTVFLRAMHSAMALEGAQALRAEQVNAISQGLGLPLESIPALMEALKREGWVDLQWGGTVSLTAKGRDIAEGKAEGGRIQVVNIGPGAQVAIGSPEAVVGAGAMGAGAQRFEYRGNTGLAVADLVALLHELQQLTPKLEPEVQPVAQELGTTLEVTLEEAKQPAPDKARLEQHLERANGIMERLETLSAAALKLAPLLKGIGRLLMRLQ